MTAPRILLLVPHPDDEVVCAAAMIAQATAAGATVMALYLTTGVPAREVLWSWQRGGHPARVARRRAEATAAAQRLGLTPLHFSDWPSRRLKTHLVEADALITGALDAQRITALWAPAWEGAHQDHDVANFLAARHAGRLPVLEFAAYSYAGGKVATQHFAAPTGGEEILSLSPAQAQWKRSLLALYRSEQGNLRHIGVAQESRRPIARHDYTRPPHMGPLFYQRFQWVPFRHPRIDFDRPEAVCAALAASSLLDRPAGVLSRP